MGIGVVVGGLGSVWIAGSLRSVLFEVETTDVATFVGAITVMLVVGAVGSYVPARRVASLDPVRALREE